MTRSARCSARTAFGFVFQFGQLVPELTAADNIAMPLVLNRAPRGRAYQQADWWLERLVISLLVIGATLPLLGRITGLDNVRFE